jgi:hypothetical protein
MSKKTAKAALTHKMTGHGLALSGSPGSSLFGE